MSYDDDDDDDDDDDVCEWLCVGLWVCWGRCCTCMSPGSVDVVYWNSLQLYSLPGPHNADDISR